MNRKISVCLRTLQGFVYLALRAETAETRQEYLAGIERAARALQEAFNEDPRLAVRGSSSPVLEGRRVRVLLADDHEINRLLVEEVLRGAGYVADSVRDGAEALARIESGERYDAVLMDLQMPVMDGFDATRAIRRLFTPRELPIIAMTAHALEEEIEKIHAVGMNDYLIKPIDLAVLQGTLRRRINGDGGAYPDGKEY